MTMLSDVSERIVKSLTMGLSSSYAVISRRSDLSRNFIDGKLIPSMSKSTKIIYCNLWDQPDDPASALIQSINSAINRENRGLYRKLKTLFKQKVKVICVNKIFQISSNNPQHQDTEKLNLLDATLIKLLDGSNFEYTFIINEFDHLMSHDEFKPLTYYLRTTFDKSRNRLKTILIGTSALVMAQMFRHKNQPFYQFSSFEELDDN
jgi:hypothetical protein